MNSTDLAIRSNGADIMERVLIVGDLRELTPQERVAYYGRVCESLGLNPFTKPFDYLLLNGKLQLYALKGATDQLREIKGVSIVGLDKHLSEDGVYEVTATARTADGGRTDQDMGAVVVAGLRGEALANARMKAITKAKRRVTLSICGLGWLDESEVDSIPSARRVQVDQETGEIIEGEVADEAPPAEPPKRWNQKQLAWLYAQFSDLKPKPRAEDLHRILRVESIQQWPDLDEAVKVVRAAWIAEHPQPEGPHPVGSVEWLWRRWDDLAADAKHLGIEYKEPPEDTDGKRLGRFIARLALLVSEAELADVPF